MNQEAHTRSGTLTMGSSISTTAAGVGSRIRATEADFQNPAAGFGKVRGLSSGRQITPFKGLASEGRAIAVRMAHK